MKCEKDIIWKSVTFVFSFLTAYALPMFRQGRETSTKKQEERARRDPVKSHRPDLPIYGPGKYKLMPQSENTSLLYSSDFNVLQYSDETSHNKLSYQEL